jgi:hypothetical protein
MSLHDVLRLVRERGVFLWPGPDGQLRWRCVGQLPDDLRQRLVAHKAEILALLPPRWNPSAAESLLAKVRVAVAHAAAEHKASRMTAVRRNVVGLWLEVCEGFARDHEVEARHGWDAMELLKRSAGRAVAAAGLKD